MKPRICVPLHAENLSNLFSMIPRAERSGANLIEIRLDYTKLDASNNIDKLEKVIEQTSVPLIATNRQYKQGGEYLQNEEQRVNALIRAAAIGFQYIDIELTTAKLKSTAQKIKDYGTKLIVSFHDFERTPADSEMEKIVKSQMEAGADICKLVTKATNVDDNLRCLIHVRRMSEITKIVCFAMGNKGIISRAFSPIFGGYFTYASLESGLETASGQISITKLKRLYRELGVDK